MRGFFTKTGYSPKLDRFFKHAAVDAAMFLLISASVVAAIGSLLFESPFLEYANLWFSVLFSVELSLRYLTYTSKRKKEYFGDWWIDWVATIPWEIFLFFLFPRGGSSMLRLLRLPRVFRLLRFRGITRSEAFRWLSYRFRRLMEISILRQVMTMLLVSLAFVWIFTIIMDRAGIHSEHGDNSWFAIITMISSDSLFEIYDQEPTAKAIILLLSFIGIVLFNGILIAIIIGKLMEHLDELKSGRGDVRESGHIVLLGWNECVPHILDELEAHCVTERKRLVRVVVMREYVLDSSNRMTSSRPHVEVISRIGGFQNEDMLERISAHKASAVVVLGEPASDKKLSEQLNDPIVTKTLVALETLLDKKRNEKNSPVIVLNYFDLNRSHHVTRFLRPFSNLSTKVFFNPLFFTGKLIASMCVNPYADDIFNELLTSRGSEFHFVSIASGRELLFGELSQAFPRAIPIGYRKEDGALSLVPSPDEPISEDAEIIVLSDNSHDSTLFVEPRALDGGEYAPLGLSAPPLQNLVIIGVNPKLPFIVEEMHELSMQLLIVDNQSASEFESWYKEYSRTPFPPKASFAECSFRTSEEVEAVIDIPSIDRVIILADGYLLDAATPDQIDAATISKLLMLSDLIDEKVGGDRIHLILETLTVDSEIVVRNIRNCTNVIGPLTIGRLLTTFALQPEFEALFRKIIQFGEVDIVCHPLDDVLPESELPTFGELLANRFSDAIPLGWVRTGISSNQKDGDLWRSASTVELNPGKEQRVPRNASIIYLWRRNGDTDE